MKLKKIIFQFTLKNHEDKIMRTKITFLSSKYEYFLLFQTLEKNV